MLPDYDFSDGQRGKYLTRYREGTNVVLLDPDVAAAFPDAAAVNRTLRLLVSVARAQVPASKQAERSKRGHTRSAAKASKQASRRRRPSGQSVK
jgi:hypothetical protein